MKNKINKSKYILKASVLLFAIIFITASFTPAVISQNEKIIVFKTNKNNNLINFEEESKEIVSSDSEDKVDIIKFGESDPLLLGVGDWWNTGWSFRKLITIDHSSVPENLVIFRSLFQLSWMLRKFSQMGRILPSQTTRVTLN